MTNYLKDIKMLFILAFPLMLSQFFSIGKEMVDTLMVGNIDKYNLAGMSLANSIYWFFIWFIMWFNFAIIAVFTRFVAQKDFNSLKNNIHQNLYIAAIIGSIGTVVLLNADFIFSFLSVEEQTKEIARSYLSVLGAFAIVISFTGALKIVLLSFAKNKAVLNISMASFFLNIPLNYVFIFQLDMGAVGSAWATVFCHVLEFIIVLGYIIKLKDIKIFYNFTKYDFTTVKQILSIGLPAAAEVMIIVGVYSFISLTLGFYGETQVGAHQILFSYFATVITLMAGLGTVMAQKISHLIGLNDKQGVRKLIKEAVGLVIMMTIILSSITFFLRYEIAGFYTDDAEVIAIVVSIFVIAPLYQLFDNFRTVGVGIIRAYKLNKQSLTISIFTYWIIAFMGGSIAAKSYGVFGFWACICLCFFVGTSITYYLIYKQAWLKND